MDRDILYTFEHKYLFVIYIRHKEKHIRLGMIQSVSFCIFSVFVVPKGSGVKHDNSEHLIIIFFLKILRCTTIKGF